MHLWCISVLLGVLVYILFVSALLVCVCTFGALLVHFWCISADFFVLVNCRCVRAFVSYQEPGPKVHF